MRLDIQQVQKLVMTTELRQSIEILGYNLYELEEFLQEKANENPTLEYSRNRSSRVHEFESFIYKEKTLYDYLYEQLIVLDIDEESFKMCEILISSIDSKGFINIEGLDKKYSKKLLDNSLKIIQSLEPPGIGAKDVVESLTIQAKIFGYDEITVDIINNHLEDIVKNPANLAQIYNISVQSVVEKIKNIKELNPKPGSFINNHEKEVQYIVPDVIMALEEKQALVYYNDEEYPSVSENLEYKNMLNSNIDSETKNFLKSNIQDTNWIINSIAQRRTTIVNITKAIVNKQLSFFVNNDPLIPMTMKEIAEELNIHESTVSRSVNGKYLQSPKGIYELRSFFTSAIDSDSGQLSSQNIKDQILEIINGEDKSKPLSDQGITDILKNRGIQISRRTVAKYRDELGILSGSKRKQYY